MKRLLLIAGAALALLSCSKVGDGSSPVYIEFFAGTSTKTTVSGSDILWEAGDQMSIFDGTSNNRFSTVGSGPSSVFSGKAMVFDTYYALYPYNETATQASGVISTTIPETQIARLNSFAAKSNISVGKTTGKTIQMKNLCGYLLVGIRESGKYKNARIFTASSEQLSGDVNISMTAEGEPTSTPGSSPSSRVILSAQTGTLDAGSYYIPVIPGEYSGGLIWVLEDNDGNLYQESEEYPHTVSRCVPLNIGNLDENVVSVTKTLSVNSTLSEANPAADKTSALVVLNTNCDDVTASVKSSTFAGITIEKTAYNKFLVNLTNSCQNPEQSSSATVTFSADGVSPVNFSIIQNGLLKLAFDGSVTFDPALPTKRLVEETSHSFTAGDETYTFKRSVCRKSGTLFFTHYDSGSGAYAYLEFPAISGKTLTKVIINFKAQETYKKCYVQIRDSAGNTYSSYLKLDDISSDCTHSLALEGYTSPVAGKAYRIVGTANANCFIKSFDLVYE